MNIENADQSASALSDAEYAEFLSEAAGSLKYAAERSALIGEALDAQAAEAESRAEILVKSIQELEQLRQKQKAKRVVASPNQKSVENVTELLSNMAQQYQEQTWLLWRWGMLEPMPNDTLGYVDINAEKHYLPRFEDLAERIIERSDILMQKFRQGFRQLTIWPQRLGLKQFIGAYRWALETHNEVGRIHNQRGEPVQLDKPLSASSYYRNADIDGRLVYFQFQFDPDESSGIIKAEMPPWGIYLVEDPVLWHPGQEVGGRTSFPTDMTPYDYLSHINHDQYENEKGLTPETWCIEGIQALEKHQRVIDDVSEGGCMCCLVGAYLRGVGSYGEVPVGYTLKSMRTVRLHSIKQHFDSGRQQVDSACARSMVSVL